jgi:PIN domain nuclease of toxin-antitoxin system
MRLLLDSQALLWFCEGNAALSAVARVAIEDEDNEKLVSHATAWEVAIKISLGKLKLPVPFEDFFPGMLLSNGFRELPHDFRHYRELLTLPFHHRDPFDRLLIAQAKVENLTVVTSDSQFRSYDVVVLW